MAEHKSRRRHVSDDVKSLDSWSEAISAEDSSKLFDNKTQKSRRESEVLLSPSRLTTIKEPEETALTRVTLLKSDRSCVEQNERGNFSYLYALPKNIYETHKHKQNKKKHKHLEINTDTAEPSNYYGDCAHSAHNRQLHINTDMRDTPCTCRHCERLHKYSDEGSRHDILRSSQNYCFKQPHNTATGFRPFGQTKVNPNSYNFGNDVDQGDKVKNKMMSVFNNIKYGWTFKTKTTFVEDSPIFLLGRCYHKRPEDDVQEPGRTVPALSNMEAFKQDFQSRLWFTYRRDFLALPSTKLTTDCGWGCMLRSGQMMLAQAFLSHFLHRDWRVHNQSKEEETFYRHIIQWFGDSASDQCPFSVHRLSDLGKVFGKQPGEWYGPSSVAYILRDAVNRAYHSQPILKDLCIYVAQDCTVYKQDIIKLCSMRPRNYTSTSSEESYPGTSPRLEKEGADSETEDEWNRSVIILIPVRLGGEEFNPIYSACIKNLMAQETCLGVIGGKPKHSLYFMGWQEDKLIYLDPHFCQDFVDTLKRDFKIETFHCVTPKKISISKIDPSATIGFYCRTKADFDKFVEQSEEIASPSKGGGVYPMFVFNEGKGSDLDISDFSMSVERSLRVQHRTIDTYGRTRSKTIDSEDYVVL